MNDKFLIPVSPREDAFNRIKQFMSEGDITLQAKEEQILKRWIYADKLMVQRKYSHEQIKEKISELFDVSMSTANSDIFKAQELFASTITVNKKYCLWHHAEHIKLMISKCSNDKSLMYLLPKLEAEYTRAINSIPDEQNKKPMEAPVMIFNVIEGQGINMPKTFEEAVASMKKRQEEKEYSDFEEVKDE